jgi:hypothetical protein
MTRTKQTARKSTGGSAPRRKLAKRAARKSQDRFSYSFGEDDGSLDAPVFRPLLFETERTAVSLGYCFSKQVGAGVNKLSKAPVFDMDDSELVETFLPGYVVQREPTYSVECPETMNHEDEEFMNELIRRVRKKFPVSTFAVIYQQKGEDGKTSLVCIAQEKLATPEFRHFKELAALTRVLETGQMNGCELQGDRETAQFGLVASRDLKPGTPVIVECGMIWSFDKHDEMLKKQREPMLGLSANQIPVKLLRPTSSKAGLEG